MNSEKGITLVSLVIYIVVFMIILAIMATISSHFYENVGDIRNAPKYITEFNKFSMFFVSDVKNNKNINSITSNSLELGDGTKYEYTDNAIFRNDKKIAQQIKSFSFEEIEHTQNEFTKKIIKVNMVLGKGQDEIIRNIDFVLKYW